MNFPPAIIRQSTSLKCCDEKFMLPLQTIYLKTNTHAQAYANSTSVFINALKGFLGKFLPHIQKNYCLFCRLFVLKTHIIQARIYTYTLKNIQLFLHSHMCTYTMRKKGFLCNYHFKNCLHAPYFFPTIPHPQNA